MPLLVADWHFFDPASVTNAGTPSMTVADSSGQGNTLIVPTSDGAGGTPTGPTVNSSPAFGFAANGFIGFQGQPAVNDTVTINGTAFTFVASGASGNQINIGSTPTVTAANAVSVLNASAVTGVAQATYATGATPGSNFNTPCFYITNKSLSSSGNSFTISTSSANVTTYGATTLTGGMSAAALGSSPLPSQSVLWDGVGNQMACDGIASKFQGLPVQLEIWGVFKPKVVTGTQRIVDISFAGNTRYYYNRQTISLSLANIQAGHSLDGAQNSYAQPVTAVTANAWHLFRYISKPSNPIGFQERMILDGGLPGISQQGNNTGNGGNANNNGSIATLNTFRLGASTFTNSSYLYRANMELARMVVLVGGYITGGVAGTQRLRWLNNQFGLGVTLPP